MSQHNCLGLGRDRRLNQRGIDVVRGKINIDEHGHGTKLQNWVNRRRKTSRNPNDLITPV